MNDKIKTIIADFNNKLLNETNVSNDTVISFLDSIANNLNLEHIYVCEQTAAKNQYMYPYVSSGPFQGIMDFNLILFPEIFEKKLANLFKKDGFTIFKGDISNYKRALSENNLAYGFLENKNCFAFVSFQAKEGMDRVWNDEDKEILKAVSLSIKPLLTNRTIVDRYAYQENLNNVNLGIFWYYPLLNLIIFPENTMEKYNINRMVYTKALESFPLELVNENEQELVINSFKGINKKHNNSSFVFKRKDTNNEYFHITLKVNKYNKQNKPIQVMGILETSTVSDEEKNKAEILEQYDKFRETITNDNIAEYYVDLVKNKFTTFKVTEAFKQDFNDAKENFDELVNIFAKRYISIESQEAFLTILNHTRLYSNNTDAPSLTLTSNFIINGEVRRLQTIIVFNNKTIHGYKNDAMIFVRDVTLTEQLDYDRLTGLLSTSHFVNEIKNLENKEGFMIYFDFSNFKIFNLEYGVKAGDEALKDFANILKNTFKTPLISRFGDDHFIVFDKKSGDENVVIKKINTTFKKSSSFNYDFRLDIKAGYVSYDTNIDVETNIDYSQFACQQIKKVNNINIKKFDEELKEKNEKQRYIIDHIDEAIKNNYIKLYYQPVVSTSTKKLCAMEALTRWIDPKYGFMNPGEFIQVLEENNLIYKIDVFVINEICKNLRKELDLNHKVVQTSFNLSRNDFLSCKPFEEVEKAVNKYNIDKKLICVEITESVTMSDAKLINKAVKQFQDAGYEVWMDDFGAGYSSLNVLKDFTFDEIKIDMAFLKTFNDKSKTIVKHTVSMAKDLKIRTLTEGVETEEHLDFLTQVGCERIQGYYYSKPLPYDQLLEVLNQKHIDF